MIGRTLASLVIVGTALVTAAPLDGQATEDAVRERLVGAYRLISYVTWNAEGEENVTPYTEGTIMYNPDGRMSVHLRHADRTGTPGQGDSEAARAALYSSYIAYYGAYSINPDEEYVTHHTEGALSPGLMDQDLRRYYELSPDGRDLFLRIRREDGSVSGEVIWQRY